MSLTRGRGEPLPGPGVAPGTAVIPQAATRMLARAALRSLEVR